MMPQATAAAPLDVKIIDTEKMSVREWEQVKRTMEQEGWQLRVDCLVFSRVVQPTEGGASQRKE